MALHTLAASSHPLNPPSIQGCWQLASRPKIQWLMVPIQVCPVGLPCPATALSPADLTDYGLLGLAFEEPEPREEYRRTSV